ncbi:hypothetical protein F4781DRAFT_437250 [Annulohypoxylon bovei var. microspora]|nr:hypothetical protein F4781DRAFT_437250 [Annulohypoxylon bovei var. microspora]
MAAYPQIDHAYLTGNRDGPLHQAQAHEEPTTLVHQGDPTQIPLVCYSCEKQQRFSDLSHLLTHVSSKAHLLELHNLQILSQVDEGAAMRCRQFDIWYKTYNIKQLVLQRMEARGEKGAQLSRRSQTPRDSPVSRPTMRRGNRGSRGGRGSRGRRGDTNSRGRTRSRRVQDLADIKYESDEGMSYAGGYNNLESPAIQSWQNHLNALMSNGGDLDIVPQTAEFESIGDENASPKYPSSEGSSFPSEVITDTTEMNEVDAGTPALKGTVFPGMGLFDAAKEEQRRKRNQRKPPAVLQQLEVNSTLVSTDENVFDVNFDHQRTRDVYDDPSTDEGEDDIEEEDEDELETKRKRRGPQTRAASAAKKTRHSATSRDARVTRANQAATQAAQRLRLVSLPDSLLPERSQALDARGRMSSRSAMDHGSMPQTQLPLHSHGYHNDIGMYHDSMDIENTLGWDLFPSFAGNTPADTEQILPVVLPEGEDGSELWRMPFPFMDYGLTFPDSHDRLPGLALRPGNPNLSFVTSSPGIKRSPTSHFNGKENESLGLKQAAAPSNPYLQAATSATGENYNPLYVQPRDGLGFNMYSSYDEGLKPATTTNFQPINGQSGFSSLQMTPQHNAGFPPNQGGSDFDL